MAEFSTCPPRPPVVINVAVMIAGSTMCDVRLPAESVMTTCGCHGNGVPPRSSIPYVSTGQRIARA
eukprot:3940745-Rhodomonas_salina.7